MMIKSKQFKVVVEIGLDGWFVGSVPALPGCHTQAKTFEELRVRLREAIELCLEVAKQDSTYRRSIQDFSYEPSFVGLETLAL